MPPSRHVEFQKVRPCAICNSKRKAEYAHLLKTNSLRNISLPSCSAACRKPFRDTPFKNHHSVCFENVQSTESDESSGSRILPSRLRPSQSFLHKEYAKIRALNRNYREETIPEDVEDQRKISIKRLRENTGENDDSNYEIVSPIRTISEKIKPDDIYRAAATQTSAKSTLRKDFFQRIQSNKNNVVRYLVRPSGVEKSQKNQNSVCSRSSFILICIYAFMVILGIAISVAVTQRSAPQPRPRRPASFPGGQLNFQETEPADSNRRRLNPTNVPVQTNFRVVDDTPAVGAASIFPPFKSANRPAPSQPAPTPVRVSNPQRVQILEEPRATVISSQSRGNEGSKRQGPTSNFNHQFGIADQLEEEAPVGRKEPEVKIIKSWANTHQDGSYTWGYINTDGSFKNETRGADCVVRGIYGYVDIVTGETISHPYVSGNPCDPNEPDYYYDYDTGTINADGAIIQERNPNRDTRRRTQQ